MTFFHGKARMIATLSNIAVFLITISVLVIVHEWGHFVVARCFKVKVLRFSIGFGKALWRRPSKSGTEYVIALLPLGGYVKLLDEREGPVPDEDKDQAFNRQPFWKRTAIVLAGPLINILFAIIVFTIIWMIGVTQARPIIGEVIPNSIAAESGVPAGGEIVVIGKQTTHDWQSVMLALVRQLGNKGSINFHILSAAANQPQSYSLSITDWVIDPLEPNILKSLGIVPSSPPILRKVQFPLGGALIQAVNQVETLVVFNFIAIGKLVSGKISLLSLGGPISIYQTSSIAFSQGVLIYLAFLGIISVMLGCLNILPIPGLDGGHLLFFIIEAIIRRPVSVALQVLILRIGFIFLAVLIFQATINDLMRILR